MLYYENISILHTLFEVFPKVSKVDYEIDFRADSCISIFQTSYRRNSNGNTHNSEVTHLAGHAVPTTNVVASISLLYFCLYNKIDKVTGSNESKMVAAKLEVHCI